MWEGWMRGINGSGSKIFLENGRRILFVYGKANWSLCLGLLCAVYGVIFTWIGFSVEKQKKALLDKLCDLDVIAEERSQLGEEKARKADSTNDLERLLFWKKWARDRNRVPFSG
jgi:hypothetical protein